MATLENYTKNMEGITSKLKATGARLIFATTTPVAVGTINPLREPENVSLYNAAALKIMKENGVQVNDLFGFCEPNLEKWQQPKNVHYTEEGYKALGHQVASVILKELSLIGK
jgi:acyl-CoA thioesterase-1